MTMSPASGPLNYVAGVIHCPACGDPVEELRTRDDTIEPLRYERVPLDAVRHLYGQCERCGTWVEGVRRPDRPGTRLADFTLTWDPDHPRVLSRRRLFTRVFAR